MAGKLDRYIHLLLRERLGGPPPDLSAGILDAIDSGAQVKALPATQPFRPWMAVAAAIAVTAAIALGVSAYLVNRDAPATPTARGDNTVRVIPSEQEKANQQEPQPQPDRPVPKPAPKPEPKVPEQVEKPEPEPQPQPTPPKPQEAPVVDKPEPKPEPEPETPKPEDPKPEGPTVDKPEPPKPEPERPPTEAEPPKPAKIGTVLYTADRARLEFRDKPEGKWQDWVEGSDVLSGMQFKTRKPAAIELPDGARFYFDGEITVSGDDKTVDVSIADNAVYFDAYGSKRVFTVRRNESVLTFKDAELLAERLGAKLSITCLGGEVSNGDVKLTAGYTATLDDGGFSRPKATDKARKQSLVEEIDKAFVLIREEFSAEYKSKVYCGDVHDGMITGSGKECSLGFELLAEFAVRERAYLRIRVRVHGSRDGLSLGFGSGKGSEWAYFQTHLEKVANEEWVVLRVPLAKFIDEGRKKAAGQGVVFHKFQIVLWTKEGSSVDMDWFELGIDPEWNVKEK